MTTKIKSGVISDNAITSAHISSGAISSSHLTGIDTDAVSEGSSNLYFTTARVDSHLSGGTGVTYSSGAISIGQSVATSASPTFANLTLTGNLNITGDVDSVSVTDLDVTDKTITVGVGGTASANDGAGLVVDGASASILWDNSNGEWDINKPINVTGTITSSGNITGTLATAAQPNITSLGTLTGLTGGTGDLNWDSGTLFVDSSANAVGIGTTSLSSPLEVRCDSNNRGISIVEQGVGTETWKLGVNTDGDLIFLDSLDTTASVTFQDATGYVGIGLTDPSAILHIEVADNTEFLKATITGNESWAFKGASGSGATDYVSFGLSGSTQCMTWQEDGNVGIGTDSPSTKLHVVGSSLLANNTGIDPDNYGNYVVAGAISDGSGWGLSSAIGGNAGTGDSWAIGTNGSNLYMGYGDQANANSLQTFLQVNGRNVSLVPTSGNVGIGTDSPDADLHVEGVTRTKYLRFQNLTDATSEVAGMYSSSGSGTNDLSIYASALSSTSSNITFLTAPTNSAATTTLFLEGSSGNVGIGTNNPDYALDVYDVGEAWIRADSSHTTESTANSGLRFAHGGVNHGVLYHRGSDDALLYFDNIASSTRFLLDSSGKFGIGTDNPSGSLHLTTVDSGGADVHYVAQNTISNRIAGYKILDESGNNQVSLTYDNGSNRGNLNLGQADGEILYVYGGSSVKSGFGIDLSGNSRELSMFHTTSGSNGNISLGQRLESTGAYTEHMRIDYKGTKLADGAMAYEQDRPFFSGANASSYSTSTNLAYTKSTDQYSVTGEAFKARVRARAYTKYVHMKTNLSADNIMFFFRIYGYFYNYGVNECVRGGYTYQSDVIQEAVANAYNTNSNYTIGDFYRSSSGNYLCVRLDVHHTAYTEGEALVFFGSHSNTVTRELEITDMQHRDDGNNAY